MFPSVDHASDEKLIFIIQLWTFQLVYMMWYTSAEKLINVLSYNESAFQPFCLDKLSTISLHLIKWCCKLDINWNYHLFLCNVADSLSIFLFIFGKALLLNNAASITFQDAIQPLVVEMYMIACLLHAFQQHNLWHLCNDWPQPVETRKLMKYQQKQCTSLSKKVYINFIHLQKNCHYANKKASIFRLYNDLFCSLLDIYQTYKYSIKKCASIFTLKQA